MIVRKLFILITFIFILTDISSAEMVVDERNIYIGDIVTLSISGNNISEKDIRDLFGAFDIVELSAHHAEYLLSVRCFTPGERLINIGDNHLIIRVASTLDDIQQDGLFDGANGIFEPGISHKPRIFVYIFGALCFIFICASITGYCFKKRKMNELTPYLIFLKDCKSLQPEHDGFLVSLTIYFKRFIQSLYGSNHLTDKTTREALMILQETDLTEALLTDIRKWLVQCDAMKFTGEALSTNDIKTLYTTILETAKKVTDLRNGI